MPVCPCLSLMSVTLSLSVTVRCSVLCACALGACGLWPVIQRLCGLWLCVWCDVRVVLRWSGETADRLLSGASAESAVHRTSRPTSCVSVCRVYTHATPVTGTLKRAQTVNQSVEEGINGRRLGGEP